MRLTDHHHNASLRAAPQRIDSPIKPRLRRYLMLCFVVLLSPSSIAQEPSPIPPVQLNLDDSEADHHRLHEAIHAAHVLAGLGAGYEAARILEAIKLHAPTTEPGEHAGHLLREWGLEPPLPGNVISTEISRTIAGNQSKQRQEEATSFQLRNLLAMRQYDSAAVVLIESFIQRGAIPEFLSERYNIQPRDLARWKDQPVRLADKLQSSSERHLQYRRIGLVRSIDHETGELAEAFLHQVAPMEREEDVEDERHPLEREDHREETDSREEDRPSPQELAQELLSRAELWAEENPRLAKQILALLHPFPDSISTQNALVPIAARIAKATQSERISSPRQESDHPVFNAASTHRYQLVISEEAQELLQEEPKHYVRATFYAGDDRYENVGVRIKGGWGSFRPLDETSKTAFTIKFNQFIKGQRYHGLRRIILNNAVQDPSYIRETLGYQLFRKAGIPAPRTTHALLEVNGRSFGLYVQVEAVTKDYLNRWFGKGGGNLYEGPGDVTEWRELDLDSNQDKEDRSDLRSLTRAIERADNENPWASLSRWVNLDSFSRFLAMESLLHHWDGYHAPNNYRLYRHPTTELFEFMPHGGDQLFEDWRATVFHPQGGILARALLQTEQGKSRYTQSLSFILRNVWDEDELRKDVAFLYQRIRPHLASNPTNIHRLMEFEETVYDVLRFIETRRYIVARELRDSNSEGSWRERRDHDEEFFERSFDEWH